MPATQHPPLHSRRPGSVLGRTFLATRGTAAVRDPYCYFACNTSWITGILNESEAAEPKRGSKMKTRRPRWLACQRYDLQGKYPYFRKIQSPEIECANVVGHFGTGRGHVQKFDTNHLFQSGHINGRISQSIAIAKSDSDTLKHCRCGPYDTGMRLHEMSPAFLH